MEGIQTQQTSMLQGLIKMWLENPKSEDVRGQNFTQSTDAKNQSSCSYFSPAEALFPGDFPWSCPEMEKVLAQKFGCLTKAFHGRQWDMMGILQYINSTIYLYISVLVFIFIISTIYASNKNWYRYFVQVNPMKLPSPRNSAEPKDLTVLLKEFVAKHFDFRA